MPAIPASEARSLRGENLALRVFGQCAIAHRCRLARRVVQFETAFLGQQFAEVETAAHPDAAVAARQQLTPLLLGEMIGSPQMGGSVALAPAKVLVASIPQRAIRAVEDARNLFAFQVHGLGDPPLALPASQQKSPAPARDRHLVRRIRGKSRAWVLLELAY